MSRGALASRIARQRRIIRPALSVSITTRDSSTRLAGAIAQARRFADEVVVGVDAASQDDTWQVAAGLADTAYRFTHPNQLAPAHRLPFRYCRGRWILRLDDDEVMEGGFAPLVDQLLATERFTHYWLPRKWVVSLDPPLYLHAAPWYPDYQLRLLRNDASLAWKPPRYHSGYKVAGHGAYEARAAILHYEPIVCTPEQRALKLEVYRTGGGNGVAEELFGEKIGERRAFQPLPAARATRPARRRIHPQVQQLAIQPLPPWGCRFLEIDMPRSVAATQQVVAVFKLVNTGQMTWLPRTQASWPILNIGVQIRTAAGAMVEDNGPRIAIACEVKPGETTSVTGWFHAPAEPGDYILSWDLVSELECWFAQCGSQPVETPLRVTL